jgi:hypothetical protein
MDLYALAFVQGEYADPASTDMTECFSVIYLRPHRIRRRFCIMSINEEGHFFNRSNPGVSNVDQMLLWAWDENQVHPAEWTLYCEQDEDAAEQITDPTVQRSYLVAMCSSAETIDLFYMRRMAKLASKAIAEKRKLPASATLPLFRFKVGRQRNIRSLVDRLTRSGAMSP